MQLSCVRRDEDVPYAAMIKLRSTPWLKINRKFDGSAALASP